MDAEADHFFKKNVDSKHILHFISLDETSFAGRRSSTNGRCALIYTPNCSIVSLISDIISDKRKLSCTNVLFFPVEYANDKRIFRT